jgi:tetratricopeptide (TPR) repeat protein
MISRALTYAHNSDYVLFGKSYHGIIHRDLKPSNLMLSKDGRVKLMDFGIARPVETSLMTLDGAVMGTMQYLAPEQIDGKNVGVAADIYALGAVSYEMLTGCKAFPQKNLSQLMAAKTENSFVPLRSFRIAIPPRFKTLVVSCMEHDPRKRVSSTAAALQDLENVHRRLTSDAPEEIVRALMRSSLRDRTVLTARKPFPVRMVAAVCGVVIAAIAASFLVVSSSKNERMPPPSAATQAREAAVGAFPKSVERTDSAKQSAARSLKLREKPASSKLPSAPAGKAKQVDEPKAQPVASTPVTFEMFEKEVESGNFENALQLFRKVPKEAAEQKNAQLLLLRALYGLGRVAEAGALITTHNIDDGEFYLIKAKYLVRRGDCDQSMNLLEKSLAVHARYLDADVIRRDYLYCRATCLSRRFDQNPSLENRKTALDAWFEVKNAVRRFPSHQYFGDAVAEMQRIGDLAKSSSPEKKEAMQ